MLIAQFAASQKPYRPENMPYPLPELLVLVLCSTLTRAEDVVEIKLSGQVHPAFLRCRLP